MYEDRSGLFVVDVKRLKSLGIEEFLKRRIEDSELFMQNHRNYPPCSDCPEPVSRPENLVRYFGRNYHNECFLKVYEGEKDTLKGYEKSYFDLVRDSIDFMLLDFFA
jgi:hypothetical protein